MVYDPRSDLIYLNGRIDKLEASMKAIVKALQLFLESTNYNKENKNEHSSTDERTFRK